jgi:hypothetical protein
MRSRPNQPSAVAFALPICAIAVVALLGALRIFDPPYGDQALFLVGAMKLHAGGVLYRDFWDLKQPGIFAFYLIGGSLFGFSTSGVHEFELLWQLAFAALLVVALRPRLHNVAAAAVAPLLAVGSYYSGTVPWHLTQVEGLVGFPLFCFVWAAIAALERSPIDWRLALLSGFGAGIVVNWKWLFGAIVISALIVVVRTFGTQHNLATFMRSGAIWALAFCIPVAAFVLYATFYGILPLAYVTFFELPRRLATELSATPASRLWRDARWFFGNFSALVVLAATGFIGQRRATTDLARSAWTRASLAWLASDLVVFLVQRQSWWLYHLLLLLPPLAILGTFGVDNLVDAWRFERRGAARSAVVVVAFAVTILGLPLVRGPLETIEKVASLRPFTPAALQRYDVRTDQGYAADVEAAHSFDTFANVAGDIYVCGDPTIYLLVGRSQGVAINGWLYSLERPEQWAATRDDIQRRRLPYVFVSGECGDMLPHWAPGLAALLANDYRIQARTPEGLWYSRTAL